MNTPLEDIRAAIATGHTFTGKCWIDILDSDTYSRDPACPACRVLLAINEVVNGQRPAEDADQVAYNIVAAYALRPSAAYLESEITAALRKAAAAANHRALDIQYALDAEHRAHQPIRIDSGDLPAKYANAFWWRRGVGWQSGSLCDTDNGEPAVRLPHGTKIPLTSFTHWLPAPGDPTLLAAEVKG